MGQKKRKNNLKKKIRDSFADPDKRDKLIAIAKQNTVNTKAFWTGQSFGAAGPVKRIDPSEFKFNDDKDKK
jgi:hypothetical protein